ncbi:MAG: 5'-nucleotidase C-terminal domain-containing protein [Lachnospiraceae bacterium]|nr:5'-nucleotidase C-terminal domain-containing protein [Lachnospiraceae bacterium]
MKKLLLKLCAFILVFAMIIPGAAAFADDTAETPSYSWAKDPEKTYDNYEGKTVILHSNDVHGQIDGYTYIKGLKNYYEGMGAEVITIDAGDFSQGDPNVNLSFGLTAVNMMNAVGYDFSTIGNHEFDFGLDQLKKNLKSAKFKVLCANVFDENGKTLFDANAVWKSSKSDLKIGFFGLDTPEAQTKCNPIYVQGLKFAQGEELYKVAQKQVDKLSKKADLVICIAHLGTDAETEPNNSYNVYNNTKGIDLIIDGHAHKTLVQGINNEPIQSTGTKFAYVGMVMIDNATKEIEQRELITANRLNGFDEKIDAIAEEIINDVKAQYGAVFAKSLVNTNGEKGDENTKGNRTAETNAGDLLTDAMLWAVTKDEGSIAVDKDHIICVTNGGGIRAAISKGDISKLDINTVLPYDNTVTVVYITGRELLEALEASTFCTPSAVGGFPQIAGFKLKIYTNKAFKQGELYPGSTYHAPKKIKRVKITSVNGKPFNKDDVYAVVCNSFMANGGDTYYVFKNASAKFDTGIRQDEALMDYIENELGGVIGKEYKKAQGRIKIKK